MDEKIVLVNVHSVTNAGDEALLISALQQLESNFPGSQVTLSMNDPENYRGNKDVCSSIHAWVLPLSSTVNTRWRIGRLIWLLPATILPVVICRVFKHSYFGLTSVELRWILKAILEADLVVSAPGGYLYSSGSGFNLIMAMYPLILALMVGKPVYLMPQSIGPLQHGWEKQLLRWLLKRVRMVMVRDPVSLQLVQASRVRNPSILLIPDMAFALPAAVNADGEKWLRESGMNPDDGQPKMGMTLVNWGIRDRNFHRQDEYEAACAAAARWFVEHTGGQVVLVPQVWGPTPALDDRVPTRRVAAQLQDLAGKIFLVNNPLPVDLLKAVYGQMDVVIGTRMHSNIFALSEGVPVIAIGYQHKTRGIAEMVGIGRWVLDIRQVDEALLVNHLEALWSERKGWREQILHTIPELIHRAGKAGEMIRHDYKSITTKP